MRRVIAVLLLLAASAAVWLSLPDSPPRLAPEAPGDGPGAPGPAVGEPDALPRSTIVGRVLTWEWKPVPGRTVRVVQGNRAPVETSTGPEGSFEVTDLAPFESVTLSVRPDGSPEYVDDLEPGEVRSLDVVLAGGE